jgi:predicted CoA-substrate-specific enzyme activase
MFAAGIDLGSSYCKYIILRDTEIVMKGIYPIEGDPQRISKKVMNEIFSSLKIKWNGIKIVCTGRNRKKLPVKSPEMTEITCIAKGAYKLLPSIRTIVDVGALTNKIIKINAEGRVMDYVINDKCASGSGMFLELVAKALEMDISKLGEKASLSVNPLSISNQCSIFAESEVIYLVNEGKNESDIAAGVCNSIAGQIYSLLKRINMEADIALVGGVANNIQIKRNLEERLNLPLKQFAIDPFYITAYGAALFAAENWVGAI